MTLRVFKNHALITGLGAFMFFAHGSACRAAGNIETLTKQNVKEFIEDTTDITTTNTQALSPEKFSNILKHILIKRRVLKAL